MALNKSLPTWPFCEDDVIVIFRCSLNKGYTRVILPVPHGLLKQGFVCPWKENTTATREIGQLEKVVLVVIFEP